MWTRNTPFNTVLPAQELAESEIFAPRFDANGLIPVIAQEVGSGDVLMLAWMNAEALRRTIDTGEAWYWSRSRQAYWRKGETSGHTQMVEEIRLDCDQDAILLKVRQTGPACHTERHSCFYRHIEKAGDAALHLRFIKN